LTGGPDPSSSIAALAPEHTTAPSSNPAPSLARKAPLWLRITTWSICAIVIAFVTVALIRQFRLVQWSQVHFRLLPACAAVACIFGVSAMQLAARWTLLIAYGYPLGWRMQLPAAWVPQIGKYVPGGVISVGGGVYLLRKYGVPGAIGLSVSVLLDALAVMAGLIISIPLLLSGELRARYPMAATACIVMTAVGIVLLHPRVFIWMLNLALRFARREPIAQSPPVKRYLPPVLASFGQWIFAGFALWFMTGAVMDVSPRLIPLFIACAALAMTVSYLMPFTPGGIGIREGLYLLTLGPVIHAQIAIVVVAMRVIQTLIEVLLALVGVWLMRRIEAMKPLT
jgi:uncharacterized membrane protein YbhN (UPF0104 family)